MSNTPMKQTVAVIGAGSSGLAAARHFLSHGFKVHVFEREDDLGGNWNYGKPCSRVYRSTHTISSKPGTEYPDFPMPRDFPDYPHHSQILAYLQAYAEQFNLLEHIHFTTGVARVEPVTEGDARTRWSVTLENGRTASFDWLIIANGHNWCPKFPEYPGEFSGHILHSAEYRTPDIFTDRRVLIVGGGNSGCDIAVEAAQFCDRAWHSTRRAYWYMPKYILGRPADQVGDQLLAFGLPLWFRRLAATVIHRLLVGRPEQTGLPHPDHRFFETHPVINSLLPYYVGQGDITPKPDILRFEGSTVHFVDQSSIELDIIVFATGYLIRFPFIDTRHLNFQEGRPQLYLNVFHPDYDSLFVAGLIQPDSGQFGLVHWQMLAAARFAAAVRDGHHSAEALRQQKSDPHHDLGSGIRYKASTRHYLEVEHWRYRRLLKNWVRRFSQ
ncbi:Flavin-binding monooxygenase-like [Nitrosomonas aestuarii]|uniref:Flavin-binding monooxygenase-like n=1 Tax=Nitrosomonas aestuarii TaxID=52441 RepID=A0A1I3Y913_9PROT|nr:NAD(P)-binding domain-containing protein [Nitrosomonas aestuarii]SFK27889.1 Flavin-binding monooxygenase-like [Nitrosomonas aestuarii]